VNLDAKDLLTTETLEVVFNEYASEIVAAVRVRLEELRDVYEERLRTRGEEWQKEADALSERVRKAETALRELSARFEAAPGATPGSRPRSGGEGLAADLRAKGLEVIDKRASGGKLWVLGDAAQLQPVITALQGQGVEFGFAPKGGRATGGRAAWFTRSRR
jgi:predicted  nucleic acid-binding Zn-ribbon protein